MIQFSATVGYRVAEMIAYLEKRPRGFEDFSEIYDHMWERFPDVSEQSVIIAIAMSPYWNLIHAAYTFVEPPGGES